MTALDTSVSYLTSGERTGLVFEAEASSERSTHWYKTFSNSSSIWKLFQGPVDIYMFSLSAFSVLQTIGSILNVRCAHNGIVMAGPYYITRGLVYSPASYQFLAAHAFVEAVLPVGLKARGIAFRLACLACVFIMLWVAIGTVIHKNYQTPAPVPYWSWISPQSPGERLVGEYIWLWIAIFASAILYIPLYFWAEGSWSVGYTQRRASLGVLLYPLAYSLVVLPVAIAQWVQFRHTMLDKWVEAHLKEGLGDAGKDDVVDMCTQRG